MGGGPNVAANVQAGKTNSQTVGVTENSPSSITVRPKAQVETINQTKDTTNNYEGSPLLWILLILGWIAPSPNEIARGIRSLWQRK